VSARPLAGRDALVLGLGRFAGGVETVRFLARSGARVRVSDSGDPATLRDSVEAIAGTGARVVFGPQTPALLDGLERDPLVVASPAVPFDHAVLAEASRRGVETTTEIALFVARCPAPVLAVTGTKGKSTTSTLLAKMVAASGVRTHLAGNVGRSLLNERVEASDAVVLELSSFQLHWLRRDRFAPRVAVVTSLFRDHVDRHGTFEAYAEAKRALLDFQGPGDVAVLPAGDETLRAAGFETAGKASRRRFSDAPFSGPGVRVTEDGRLADAEGDGGTSLDGFRLWGRHNRRNAAAAAAAARAVGATWAEVRAGCLATGPLPHRLEPFLEAGGVLFVDDSIATTPESAAAALDAVPRPCVVLVGGKDKGSDPAPLLAAVAARARAAIGVGTTGPALVARLRAAGFSAAVEGGPDLDAAVRSAVALARPGDAVLLSPGYSSLDGFASFAERGDRFQAAAREAAGRRSAPDLRG
jgi:UDP-N-acetylmuramoylalanine--D-glutamate ligase